MDTYKVVYDVIVAAFDAEADLNDAAMVAAGAPAPQIGAAMRSNGRTLAPLVAGQVQAAVNALKTTGPVIPGTPGPLPLPYPNLGTLPGFAGLPGLPGTPGLPGLPSLPGWPGLPSGGLGGRVGSLPGIDPCALLTCLAAVMDCPCGQTSPSPGAGDSRAGETMDQLLARGLEFVDRARDEADRQAKIAERRVNDLKAAAAVASAEVRRGLQAAQKAAEEASAKAAKMSKKYSEVAGTIIGNMRL